MVMLNGRLTSGTHFFRDFPVLSCFSEKEERWKLLLLWHNCPHPQPRSPNSTVQCLYFWGSQGKMEGLYGAKRWKHEFPSTCPPCPSSWAASEGGGNTAAEKGYIFSLSLAVFLMSRRAHDFEWPWMSHINSHSLICKMWGVQMIFKASFYSDMATIQG